MQAIEDFQHFDVDIRPGEAVFGAGYDAGLGKKVRFSRTKVRFSRTLVK
jgi:hypothetical protein